MFLTCETHISPISSLFHLVLFLPNIFSSIPSAHPSAADSGHRRPPLPLPLTGAAHLVSLPQFPTVETLVRTPVLLLDMLPRGCCSTYFSWMRRGGVESSREAGGSLQCGARAVGDGTLAGGRRMRQRRGQRHAGWREDRGMHDVKDGAIGLGGWWRG
jgi:hypothetical protein